jgi:MYXO-CTERM domain-containing protein
MRKSNHSELAARLAGPLALAVALMAGTAEAYQYQETAGGRPVRWATTEVVLTLDASLAVLGPMDRVEEVFARAFELWVAQAGLPVDFTLSRGSCDDFGHAGDSNTNCLMARHMGSDSDHTGATTRLTYSDPSGEVINGDIVFNLDAGPWSLEGEAGALDLAAVALHEAGHLIGMAHSDIEEARMFPTIGLDGAEQGGLHGDDIEGAARLYEGFVDPDQVLSCSVAAAGSSRPGFAGWLLAALIAGLFLRRNRQK